MFRTARENILNRIDQLERGVGEYLDGIESQIKAECSKFKDNVIIPTGYDPNLPIA